MEVRRTLVPERAKLMHCFRPHSRTQSSKAHLISFGFLLFSAFEKKKSTDMAFTLILGNSQILILGVSQFSDLSTEENVDYYVE